MPSISHQPIIVTPMKYTTALAAILLLSPTALAQSLQINEIYISHDGTDDQEMLEIRGTPFASLDNYMVLVVEGDSTKAGWLDRAWDLTGQTVPVDGYYCLGDTAVTERDFDLGASNRLENGTNTFYLIQAKDPSSITALVGSDVDSDKNLITDIATNNGVTIVDIIGVVDPGYPATDKIYDRATAIGPNGRYGPPGVFRDETTATNAWCMQIFLDFDDVVNANAIRTPGAPNTTCTSASVTLVGDSCLTGAGTTGGPDLNSNEPVLGADMEITVSNASATSGGLVYLGIPDPATVFLGCRLYLNPAVLVPLGSLAFSSTGTGTLSLPVPVQSSLLGATFRCQSAVGDGSALHLTNGIDCVIGYKY